MSVALPFSLTFLFRTHLHLPAAISAGPVDGELGLAFLEVSPFHSCSSITIFLCRQPPGYTRLPSGLYKCFEKDTVLVVGASVLFPLVTFKVFSLYLVFSGFALVYLFFICISCNLMFIPDLKTIHSVLVSQGCCDKLLQTWWLTIRKTYFLQVLGTRSPKPVSWAKVKGSAGTRSLWRLCRWVCSCPFWFLRDAISHESLATSLLSLRPAPSHLYELCLHLHSLCVCVDSALKRTLGIIFKATGVNVVTLSISRPLTSLYLKIFFSLSGKTSQEQTFLSLGGHYPTSSTYL